MKKLVAGIVLAMLIIIALTSSSFVVEPGQASFIKRLGVIQEPLYTDKDGWQWKRPFVDTEITFNVQNNKEQTTAQAASKDLQNVSAEVAVNYNIDSSRIKDIYTNIGSENDVKNKIIFPSIQEVIKAVTSKYTAEELVTKRSDVSKDITAGLGDKLSKYGLQVLDVNIVNFSFSPEFNAAIESKVRATQDALAERNRKEKSQYEADQVVIKAKAEAEAIRISTQAINSQGGENYVKLKALEVQAKMAEKWNGIMPQYMLGDGMNMLMQLPTK